jgi:putative hydrolase of the HAD superfamily
MDHIKAIAFDLFNTLIVAERGALEEALMRLMGGLAKNGLHPDFEPFKKAYRDAAIRCITQANQDGIETHNRFWISAALQHLGYAIAPEDERISSAIESYFSAFLDFCHPVPDTLPMLKTLKGPYRLALLSNFTHAPAAVKLVHHLGLSRFFEVVLISGDIGYRKPHPLVFRKLIDALGGNRAEMLYVGDDPEADIAGALSAGIRPVWFTYARDRGSPLPPGATSDPVKIPGNDVPAISTWDEFLSLLDQPPGLTTRGP